jgi:hypothetical protein
MRNRILPGILVILGVALSGLLGDLSRDVRAQPGWDFPEFDQAREAYRREDCRGAWDIVWPLAKKGNHEARYFLHGTIVDRMIPPGDSGYPRSVFLRHNLTLAAYATLARARPGRGDPNHRWARIDIPNSINALALGEKGDRVAQCYKSDASFQTCLDLAISLGVFQKFEDYALSTEAAARETGLTARCRPHPW